MSPDIVKIIFGLKVKEHRLENQLSLSALADKTGLSVSYINEIEKGKKYPKSDKILALALAFSVPYDQLVSLKLSRKLEPLARLLESNFLNEIPLSFFGVDPVDLMGLMSEAPVNLSAFINTIIEIGRNYNLSVEDFYLATLRTYQEMHKNYFPELEHEIDVFLAKNNALSGISEVAIAQWLKDMHGVSIVEFDETSDPHLGTLRSIFLKKKKLIMVNRNISNDQRLFTLAKELGFFYLKLDNRPTTSSWMKVENFDQVLANFKASYFASGIILPKEPLEKSLSDFFKNPKFDADALNQMSEHFNVTIETLFHRISNILINKYRVEDLFFLRFDAVLGSDKYLLTKEMHLSNQYAPTGVTMEHYCRRWKSLDVLKDLNDVILENKYHHPLAGGQISRFRNGEHDYLVLAMARPLNIHKETNISVSLGIKISDELREELAFLNDDALEHKIVNRTCERCDIFDCKERMEAPKLLQAKKNEEKMMSALEKLSQ